MSSIVVALWAEWMQSRTSGLAGQSSSSSSLPLFLIRLTPYTVERATLEVGATTTTTATTTDDDDSVRERRHTLLSSPWVFPWQELFARHSHPLFESAATLFYDIPRRHVWHGWFRWMHGRGQDQVPHLRPFLSPTLASNHHHHDHHTTATTTTTTTCPPSSSLQRLPTTFVGQRRAVQAVMEAVQAWNQPYHPERSNRWQPAEEEDSSSSSSSNAFAPLLLYFTGMTSSGKVTLAKQLAHAVCATPILVITPSSDFNVAAAMPTASQADASVAVRSVEQQQRIEARIRQHVQQYPRSMILLEDADEMTHIVAWLGHALADAQPRPDPPATESAGASSDETTTSSPLPSAPLLPPSLRFVCRHAMVVFTSTVAGSRSIARLDPNMVTASATDEMSRTHESIIHDHDNHDIHDDDPSFLLNIQHEMDAYFQTPVSQWMDAVVPFLPITPMHLQAILRRKVAVLSEEYASSSSSSSSSSTTTTTTTTTTDGQDGWEPSGSNSASTGENPSSHHLARVGAWSALTISDAAVEALLHPSRVEYLSWKKQKSSPSKTTTAARGSGSVLTFSSAGVSVLSDKSMILNKIRALIHACLANDESTNDETSGTTLPARSERSNQPAVLDVTAANPKKLVLKWCSGGTGKVDQSCRIACQTSLS